MKKTFLYIFATCFVAVGSFTLMSFGDAAQTDDQKITTAVDAMKVAYLAEADTKCKASALAEAQATWDAEVAAKASNPTTTGANATTTGKTKKPLTDAEKLKAEEKKNDKAFNDRFKEDKAAKEKAAKEVIKEEKANDKKFNDRFKKTN